METELLDWRGTDRKRYRKVHVEVEREEKVVVRGKGKKTSNEEISGKQ